MKKSSFIVVCATVVLLLAAALLAACATTGKHGDKVYKAGDFEYEKDGDEISIVGYTGKSKVVNIPETIGGKPVVLINDEVFKDRGLTAVTIPTSVRVIGAGAFADNQLTEITIPNSVKEFNKEVFANNQLTEITWPDGVRTIAERAFANNRLRAVTIPNTVTWLGIDAFDGNDLATPPLIPESDKLILAYRKMGFTNGKTAGQGAARTITIIDCGGKNVVIPDAAYGIPVTRITNSDNSKYLADIREGTREFIKIESLTLPSGLAEISANAFVGYNIQEVIFPNDNVRKLWNRVNPAMERENQSIMQKLELKKQQEQNRKTEDLMRGLENLEREMERRTQ
jgi:predicted small secreted protein